MLYNQRHKTYPLLGHSPNKIEINPLWDVLKDGTPLLPLNTKLPENVTIVTFNNGRANYSEKPPGLLEAQLDRLGIHYVVLGQNAPEWQHRFKMTLLAEHLEYEPNDYVVVADSSDVFVLNRLESIVDRFLAFECETLMSRDPFMHPAMPVCEFQNRIKPQNYLNAGLWMTKRDFGRKLMEHCIALDESFVRDGFPSYMIDGEDQQYLHLSFPVFYPKIQIDYKCSLFQLTVGQEICKELRWVKLM